jgi:hypothetical protein
MIRATGQQDHFVAFVILLIYNYNIQKGLILKGVNSLIIDDLMVSGVNISEDGYDYRGTFILSCAKDTHAKTPLVIDLAAFESEDELLDKIKCHFDILETISIIKQKIMEKVISSSGLSSKDVHGENFNLETDGSTASSSLDKA